VPYVKEICRAGETIEISKTFSSRYKNKGITRGKKENPTPEKMIEINERHAETKLRRLINTNYGPGDLHITLTYEKDNRPTPEEAKEDFEKYIRKIRALFKKNGEEAKYIKVTEYKNKGIHHHLIINMPDSIPVKEFIRIWGKKKGRPHFTYFDDSGQYRKLAHYLIKETSKTFKEPGSPSHKRWNASKNLKQPDIKKKIVPAREWKKEPEPLKGYQLEIDYTRYGIHDFTGWPYQFYSMVKVGIG